MNALIAAAGLVKVYSGKRVVDDVTFEVEAGRVVGFLGPNGAGKTTTIRMLLGLCRPTSGTASVGGGISSSTSHLAVHSVGAVLSPSFLPSVRVATQMHIAAKAVGAQHRAINEAISITGVDSFMGMRCGRLSLGMKQRLGIAQAIVGNPVALILDEPTNGLDPEGIAWLRGFLRRYADSGRAVLVSSHQLAEADRLVDDVLLINHGRVVVASSVESWRSSSPASTRIFSDRQVEFAQILRDRGASVSPLPEGGLSVIGMTSAEVAHLAGAHAIALPVCESREPSLEQLFLAAVAGDATK